MDIIFPTITNYPIERDETRSAPVIDHNKPFKNLKGSPSKTHHKRGPVIPAVGSLYTSGGALPYKPSYSKIGNKTVLCDPVKDEIKHVIEIVDHAVFFNGALIASAPIYGGNGKKKTLPQRLTFCKAVVFAIIPGEIQKPIKDHPSGCTVYESAPDDLYFRELIAQYPAVFDNQDPEVKQIISDESPAPVELIAVPEDIVLPDELGAYTPEAITGYPFIEGDIEDSIYLLSLNEEIDRENLRSDLSEELYDMGSDYDSIGLENEFNKGEEKAMFEILNPAIVQNPAMVIRSWSHGRMIITEEVYA